MPFWKKNCASCGKWHSPDPSSVRGLCRALLVDLPFWHGGEALETHHDDGADCAAHHYDGGKPHPLDRATRYLLGASIGDVLPMRTYSRGEVSRTTAEVRKVTAKMVTVVMFNALYRIRLHPEKRQRLRAGTVIALPDWGVDTNAPITKVGRRYEQPERGLAMLARIKPGDRVPLIGYPPFDGLRKLARVLLVKPDMVTLVLVNGRRRMRMHRKGALAGIIDGEPWVLDTTEDDCNAGQADLATQRQATAAGHHPA